MTSSKINILYVEDEVILALETADRLRLDHGYDVSVAHNLRAARLLHARGGIDVALLDVNLGNGETSRELAQELLQDGIKVLLVTGYNLHEVVTEHRLPLIEKPFTVDELAAAVAALMAPA